MRTVDLIRRKRDGEELSPEELREFVDLRFPEEMSHREDSRVVSNCDIAPREVGRILQHGGKL